MTHTSELFRREMRRHPDELEDDVDRTRADVERTLEALRQRFSPGELLNQAVRGIRDTGGAYGRNLSTQVRNNPLPALLTGIGLTWLIMGSDRPPERAGAGARVSGDAASKAAERSSAAVRSTREKASDVAEAARGGAARAAETSRAGAQSLRTGYDKAREGYYHLSREQPFVLGALAVTVGAALGALLPRTEAEDQAMGEESDQAAERLIEEGEQRIKQTTNAAAESAPQGAQDPAGMEDRGSSRTSGETLPRS